jgi:hypothetical protein
VILQRSSRTTESCILHLYSTTSPNTSAPLHTGFSSFPLMPIIIPRSCGAKSTAIASRSFRRKQAYFSLFVSMRCACQGFISARQSPRASHVRPDPNPWRKLAPAPQIRTSNGKETKPSALLASRGEEAQGLQAATKRVTDS